MDFNEQPINSTPANAAMLRAMLIVLSNAV
jgi:hypothetical protein